MGKLQAIQIIGTQRSGSNLLRLMLNQIDEISAPHPPHILQRFYPLLPHYGDLSNNQNFKILVDDVCRLVECNPVEWTGIFLSRDEIIQECRHRSLIEIFRVIYELKANADKARFWACKSMANIQFANALEESGIRPFYIHLYRDGRDVACSFKKAIVGEKHVYHVAHQWRRNQELCIALNEELGTSRVLNVRYEDLITKPEDELQRIGVFLNIEIPAKVFDFYKSEESQKTAVAGKMWENVRKPIQKTNSNKYKKELTELEIAIFEKEAGAILIKLGYICDDLGLFSERDFTKEELESFERENSLLKKQAQKLADPEGMKLRERQEQLLLEIKERKPLFVKRA